MSTESLLEVNQLRINIHSHSGIIHAVNEVSLKIARGEIFALLGESGCGKTMTALGINRLLPHSARICEGSEVLLEGTPLHLLSESKMRKIRAKKIGMIFQDPALALNPVLTIGQQLQEAIHLSSSTRTKREVTGQMLSLLEKVRIPDREAFLNYYPHQLSGGMKQRIVIAIALAKAPDLLIADEPTTALDVTTQAQVLNLIKDLNQQLGMAILLISHDLGVVQQMADHIAVMYAGHIVERANKNDFFTSPLHPYSTQLFASLPEHTNKNHELATIPGQVPSLDQHFPLCRFKGRCEKVFSACEEEKPKMIQKQPDQMVRCHWYDSEVTKTLPKLLNLKVLNEPIISSEHDTLPHENVSEEKMLLKVENLKVYFPIQKGLFKRTVGYVRAVDDISFDLPEGKTLAIVGESGCGKTTVGKAITRLVKPYAGRVQFEDADLLRFSDIKLRAYRSHLQMIFQDPYSAMDPRFTVEDVIMEGMIALKIGSNPQERLDRVDHLLEQVGLSKQLKRRYPHELSGGQRQRVAIARALAVGAELLICDEPTSALDVSVQAQILNLLRSLQNDLVISLLFITHNISVVNYLADYVAVMYLGRIVEYGPVTEIMNNPKHPYTQMLLASVPSLHSQNISFANVKGEIPSPSNPPAGCHFSPRCPKAMPKCFQTYPDNYDISANHTTRCFLYAPADRKEKMNGR
ncbi:MAG: dipeptide ABC transporter ATP-binding protein [Candidatus Berkiella sp.]